MRLTLDRLFLSLDLEPNFRIFKLRTVPIGMKTYQWRKSEWSSIWWSPKTSPTIYSQYYSSLGICNVLLFLGAVHIPSIITCLWYPTVVNWWMPFYLPLYRFSRRPMNIGNRCRLLSKSITSLLYIVSKPSTFVHSKGGSGGTNRDLFRTTKHGKNEMSQSMKWNHYTEKDSED